MIDKEQALEIIDKRDFFNDRAGRELWNDKPKEIQDEDIRNAHEEYEQLKEYVLNQPKVGEWIPVEDRLPEKETYVLCYVPKVDGNVQYGIYVGRRLKIKADDGSGNFWGIPTKECDWSLKGWSYIDHPTIVAWQPLPEPFKGETE